MDLGNSVSRFVHLVSSLAMKNVPCREEYRNVANALKRLKPSLDNVFADGTLRKESEELDLAVNEAQEFIESWGPHMSSIRGVVRSRELILKIRSCSTRFCQTLSGSLASSSSSSSASSTLADIQNCMQRFRSLKMEITSEKIEEAMKCIKEERFPSSELLIEIIGLLHLTSSQELLKETIAVEKSTKPDHVVELLNRIREAMVKIESFKVINGFPVPSYFRCPLSLELMVDPVIVSTGQTYERGSIRKWLDHGLTRCPITREPLSHTNLIPNHTVKALVANWCDENRVQVKVNDRRENTENGSSVRPENGFKKSNDSSCSGSVSSSDYELSGETASVSNRVSGFSSPCLAGKKYHSSNQMTAAPASCGGGFPRSASLPPESPSDDLTTAAHVEKLVDELNSPSTEHRTRAAAELRFLAKHNAENRVIIGGSAAIPPLLSLTRRHDEAAAQEHAVTALLNLSIDGDVKSTIADAGAVEPLIHVLRTGNACAKENAAAALFSLSLLDDYRVKIGRSGAVRALVDLLATGTLRGKKDAATALFNLSIFHENKARIIQAGAVRHLVELADPASEMVDKAVALLSNLSTVPEGCLAVVKEGGIPPLVEVVEAGSQRGKENAAAILLQLCLANRKYCRLVLQEGVVPPLVALSLSGTSRAKEKAQQLLSHFRSQRENAPGKAKS